MAQIARFALQVGVINQARRLKTPNILVRCNKPLGSVMAY